MCSEHPPNTNGARGASGGEMPESVLAFVEPKNLMCVCVCSCWQGFSNLFVCFPDSANGLLLFKLLACVWKRIDSALQACESAGMLELAQHQHQSCSTLVDATLL